MLKGSASQSLVSCDAHVHCKRTMWLPEVTDDYIIAS